MCNNKFIIKNWNQKAQKQLNFASDVFLVDYA